MAPNRGSGGSEEPSLVSGRQYKSASRIISKLMKLAIKGADRLTVAIRTPANAGVLSEVIGDTLVNITVGREKIQKEILVYILIHQAELSIQASQSWIL